MKAMQPGADCARRFLAATTIALASAAAGAGATIEESTLEEIVVTAQKRAESIQTVPISITAVTGESIQQRNLANVVDILQDVPNVTAQSAYSARNPILFVRGIGITDFGPATSGAVGVTHDEVFLNSGIGQMSQVYDLDRVEVLKGPQGTLFGRNTTGGVISYTTRRPTYEFDPSIQVSYGRFDEFNVEAASSVPIVEDIAAARVSFLSRKRDGTRHVTVVGGEDQDVNNVDQWAARAQLLVEPNDRLDIHLKGEVGYNRSTPRLFETWGTMRTDGSGLCTASEIRASQCAHFTGYVESPDPYDGATNVSDNKEKVDSYGGRLGIDYDADSVSFASITAWNLNKLRNRQDQDSSPFRELEILPYDTTRAEQWQQEVRLSSTTDSPFQWIVGGFYLEEQLRQKAGSDVGLFDVNVEANYTQKTESLAAFAHLTYRLTTKLKATVGGRYTWEDKSIDIFSQFGFLSPTLPTQFLDPANAICCLVGSGPVNTAPPFFGVNPFNPAFPLFTQPLREEVSFNKPLWRFALDYQFDDSLVYGSYSRGVRAPSFNASAIGDVGEFSVVADEKIDAFEVGVKSDLSSWLRLNTAVFYYTGQLQVFTNATPPQVFRLASADIESYGLDADLLAQPVDGLTLSLGGGYLHGEFTDYPDNPEKVGNRLPNSPRFSLFGRAEYEFPVGDRWSLTFGVDFNHRAQQFFSDDNRDLVSEDSYTLFNGRIALGNDDSGLELALWGRNLTDRRYLSGVFDNTESFGFIEATIGDPRTYGLTVSYRY